MSITVRGAAWRLVSVSTALLPIAFGLLRAVTTGTDLRFIWTAVAAAAGAAMAHRLDSITARRSIWLRSAVIGAGATLSAAIAGRLLGATSLPAILAVATGCGCCWAIARLLWPTGAQTLTTTLSSRPPIGTRWRALVTPTALIPVVMSCGALGLVAITIVRFGVIREADEGTAAHVWQLLMAGQLPIIGFFAAKWLPRAPRWAASVLIVQAFAAMAALAPVLLLGL